MTDPSFAEMRQLSREHLHGIWQKAQRQELEDLTDEERKLGEIMLAHSEEYFNQLEHADLLGDHEFDPDNEVDPFLHITLHAVAEKQLEDRDPIEAFQFYNAMLKNKCSRHEAIHLLITVFTYFLFPVLKEKRPFRLDAYRKILKDYKTRKPERILDLLENEPEIVADEEPNGGALGALKVHQSQSPGKN